MRMIMLGPPGSGKGSLAKALTRRLPFVHVSTGDLFRREIKENTDLGQSIHQLMDEGKLVPDDLTIGLVRKVLQDSQTRAAFLLDGFPRNIRQAELFEDVLLEENLKLDGVLHVHVPDDVIIRRVSGRRVCSGCGHIYNIYTHRPRHDLRCDFCGSLVEQRPDDDETVIRERLEVYHGLTEPLLHYYEKQKLNIWDVDNSGSLSDVVDRLLELFAEVDA